MTPEQKAGKVDKGEKLDWIGKLNSFKEEREQEDDDEEDERERERERDLLWKKFAAAGNHWIASLTLNGFLYFSLSLSYFRSSDAQAKRSRIS